MDSGDPFPLIDVLCHHDVPFVVMGGHAVTFHGYLRATEDTEIIFRRSPAGESSLLAALSEVHACWIGDEIDPQTGIERTYPVTLDYIRQTHLMMLVTDFGFLDIFDYIPGFPETSLDDLFATAIPHGSHRFVSLAWLRKMKSAANRPRDQADLENLPGGEDRR
ncbi:MAG: hypothetical protein GTO53_06790 [Planctomycetales bacterium]|nr:hypothetical protein [Planctomycetales bacterium]NIM08844.1 hypothetical protein [Planctomycetales bacterium]NIN08305.1 hypothetical protein [Planctomycetales bacterium]NIN77436.1 hypothetical protein [Planctomycetales bacterium]NIO34608.1 hypothetical protein [Planctomycetales bacterium]